MTTTPLVRVDVIRHADHRYNTCGDWLITTADAYERPVEDERLAA